MRQAQGLKLPITPSSGAPSGDDADRLALSGFGAVMKVKKLVLKVKMTAAGATTADFFLWGRLAAGGDWGEVGEKAGQVNGGVTVSGSTTVVRHFVYENLGVFEALYLEKRNETGTPTITAELVEILEQGD